MKVSFLVVFFVCLTFFLHGQTDSVSTDSKQGPASAGSANHSSALFEDPPFWRQAMGGSVMGRPASQAESVVMVSDGGNIKAFGWQGKPLWDYFARGRLQPFVTRSREGTTYVCRTNGTLIAVNRSGRELWQKNLGEPMTFPVITGWDGRLFVFTSSGIRSFTASGYPLWSAVFSKGVARKPAADGKGGFYLVFDDGEFVHYDAFGKTSAETLAEIPLAVLPVIRNGNSARLFVYPGGSLEIAAADGTREQFSPGFGAKPIAAAVRGEFAAVLLESGALCLVSLAEKTILWNGETHISRPEITTENFEAAFQYDERGIYLLSRNGAAAFSEDGRRLWIIRIRGAASLPAFSDEGVLYSGGADWILYAYKLEERVRAQTRLLYGPAPEGTYGTGIRRPELWVDYPNLYNETEMETRFTEISQAVSTGQIGEKETEYAAWLMEIAGSTIAPNQSAVRPPVFVMHRSRAVRLLSYMGSMETVPFLTELFTYERDTTVKAAAAEALGRIGVDPEGIALAAFSGAVFPPAPLRDEQVLLAIAAASGAICRFSGPPLSDIGVRILTALSSHDRPPAVRSRAEREILSLRL